MFNFWVLCDTYRNKKISSLDIFLWAITNSSIADCYFFLKSPAIKYTVEDYWFYEPSLFQISISINFFVPAISLYIPDYLIREYGKKVLGDEYFYIPF